MLNGVMLNGVMLSVIMLSIMYSVSCLLNAVMLSVVMLNAVILSVVMLRVVAPLNQKHGGREPKNFLYRVFHSKLDSFVQLHSKCIGGVQPLLELKTRPRFCFAH
jgi:hypothetical protein